MTNENPEHDIQDMLKVLHPASQNQDKNCPHIRYMYEDAAHLPANIGDWTCMLQQYQHGEYNQNIDYHNCSHPNHKSCPFYLENQIKHQKP